MKVIKTGNVTVELTWEECKALVKALGNLSDDVTRNIYNQLCRLVGDEEQ